MYTTVEQVESQNSESECSEPKSVFVFFGSFVRAGKQKGESSRLLHSLRRIFNTNSFPFSYQSSAKENVAARKDPVHGKLTRTTKTKQIFIWLDFRKFLIEKLDSKNRVWSPVMSKQRWPSRLF